MSIISCTLLTWVEIFDVGCTEFVSLEVDSATVLSVTVVVEDKAVTVVTVFVLLFLFSSKIHPVSKTQESATVIIDKYIFIFMIIHS